MNLSSHSLITTDHYCYFRPSFLKAKKEIEYEMKDYKDFRNKVSKHTYEDLVKVDLTAPRVRYVNSRLEDLQVSAEDANYNQILSLIGIEHKYKCSLREVEDFIEVYTQKLTSLQKELRRFKNRLAMKLKWGSRFECIIIPLLGEISDAAGSLDKWKEEKKKVESLLTYITNKLFIKLDC